MDLLKQIGDELGALRQQGVGRFITSGSSAMRRRASAARRAASRSRRRVARRRASASRRGGNATRRSHRRSGARAKSTSRR